MWALRSRIGLASLTIVLNLGSFLLISLNPILLGKGDDKHQKLDPPSGSPLMKESREGSKRAFYLT